MKIKNYENNKNNKNFKNNKNYKNNKNRSFIYLFYIYCIILIFLHYLIISRKWPNRLLFISFEDFNLINYNYSPFIIDLSSVNYFKNYT
jgi:hypothetical protein